MRNNGIQRSFSHLVALGMVLVLFGRSAQAASDTWLGNSSVSWSDSANWGPQLPAGGDSLTFDVAGSTGGTLTDDLMTPGTYTISGLTFTAAAPAYTINPNVAGTNGFTLSGPFSNNGTALQTVNDAISLSGTQIFTTTAGGGNITLGGVLSGTGGIATAGAGTLALLGSNIYSGATTISAGTLQLGNAAAAQNSAVTVSSANGLAFSPTIGTFNLGGLSGGSNFILADTSAGGVNLSVGANNASTNYSGIMSGSSGSLTKVGGGVLTLSNENTYAGGTTVSGGTLVLNSGNGSGFGTIIGTLNINPGATVVLNLADALGWRGGGTQVNTVNIVGGTIYNNGGTQAYATNFFLTGGTMGSSGTQPWGNGFHFTNGFGVTTYGSTATSVISAPLDLRDGNNMQFNVASGTTSSGVDLLVSGQIGDSGKFTKLGNGLMAITYNDSGPATVSAGTLQLGDGTTTNGSVAGSITDNATLVFANPNTLTCSSLINGSGSLAKIGASTLILNGTNSYSGTTIIQGGTVTFGSSAAVPPMAAGITINSGATVTGGYNTLGAWLNNIAAGSTGLLSLSGAYNETDSLAGAPNLTIGAIGSATFAGTLTTSGSYQLGGGGGVLAVPASLSSGNGLVAFGLSSGTLVLSGSNSYSGGTIVNRGWLQLAQAAAMPPLSTISVASSATLAANVGGSGEFTSGLTGNGSLGSLLGNATWVTGSTLGLDTTNAPAAGFSYAGAITGPMALNKLGPGALVLTASNTYSGGTTVSAGTLQLGDGQTANGYLSGNVAVSTAAAVLAFANPTAQTYGGVISGNGGLEKSGAGLLALSNFNSYNGGTTINGGTLALNVGGGNGAIRGTLNVNPGAMLQINAADGVGYNNGGQVNPANVLGGVINNATGNDQFYRTTFTLTGGTLTSTGGGTYDFTNGFGITTNASTATSLITARINIRDSNTLSFNVAAGTTPSGVDLAVTGYMLGGNNGITKSGSGLLQLDAANTYTGTTTISAGTLQLGDGAVNNGSVAGPIADNATLTFANPNAQTYSGAISGSGNLLKSEPGTLYLTSAATSYSGTTTINGGALSVTVLANTGANSIAINPGGGLVVGGPYTTVGGWIGSGLFSPASAGALLITGTNSETLNMTSSPNLSIGAAPGGATYSGSLTPSGTYYFGGGGGVLTLAIALTGNNSLVAFNGGSTGGLILTGSNTYTGSTTVCGGTLTATTPVNLPSASALSVAGGAGMLFDVGGSNDWTAGTLGTLLGSATFAANSTLGFDSTDGSFSYAGTIPAVGISKYGPNILTLASSVGSTVPITIAGGALQFANTANQTLGGAISGSGGLMQGGSGVLLLTASNTYTGPTTISAGTLQIGNGGVLGGGNYSAAIADSGALVFSSSVNQTLGGIISGNGSLVWSGPGNLNLTNLSTFTGGTTVNGGTLTLSAGGGSGYGTIIGTLNINPGATVVLNSQDALGWRGSGTQVNTVNIVGGTIYSNGSTQAYSTQFYLTGGTMAAASGDYHFTGGYGVTTYASTATSVISANIDIRNNNNMPYNVSAGTTASGIDLLVSGFMHDSGEFTKSGAGVMEITGANTYPGTTTVTGGVLLLGASNALPADNASIVVNGGTLDLGGYALTTHPLSLTNAVVQDGAIPVSGNVSVAGSATITASLFAANGNLNVSGPGLVALAGAGTNVFTSGAPVTGGTLQFQGSSTTLLGSSGNVYGTCLGVSNATVVVQDNASVNIASCILLGHSASSAGYMVQTGGAVTVTGSNTTNFYAGVPSAMLIGEFPSEASSYTLSGGLLSATSGPTQFGWSGSSGTLNISGGTADLYSLVGPNSTLNLSGSGSLYISNGGAAAGGIQISSVNLAGGTLGALATSWTSSTAMNVNGAVSIDTAGNTIALSGNLSGTGNLTKVNGGILYLGNASYGGGTTISGGTLQVGNGSGSFLLGNVLDNSALVFANPSAQTFSGAISGSGSLTAAGPGTATLINATNSYNGGTTLAGGELGFASGALPLSSNSITFAGGALQWAGGNTQDVSAFFAPLANGISTKLDTNGNNVTLATAIAGSGGLNKLGAGALILTSSNAYTGATTITAGTLQLGNGGGTGSLPTASSITDNGTLDFNRTGAVTQGVDFSNNIAGSGGLLQNGAGTLYLTTANSFSGATTISAGTLQLGDAAAAQNSTVTVNSPSGLAFSSSIGSFTIGGLAGTASFALADTSGGSVNLTAGGNNANSNYSGVISSSGGLIKVGNGTFTLSNSNTYTGGTTVNGGILALNYGTGSPVGSIRGVLNINPGAQVQLNAADAMGYTTAGDYVTQVNIVGGAINNTTNKVQAYTANFDLTGGTMASSGGAAYCFTNGYGITTYGSTATSLISAPLTPRDSNDLVFNVASGTTANGIDLEVTGAINYFSADSSTKGDSITKAGPGLMQLAGTANIAGGATVSAGTLQLGNAAALGTGGLIANAGVLDLNAFSPTVASLSGSAGAITNSGAATATLTVNQLSNTTFNGTLADGANPVALNKTGTGTLTLNSANNYSGGTTLNGGTLRAGVAGALGASTGPLAVNTGGLLDLNGTSGTVGAFSGGGGTIANNGGGASVLTVGNGGGSGVYGGLLVNYTAGTGTVALVKTGSGTIALNGANTFTGGTTLNGGVLQMGGNNALGTAAGIWAPSLAVSSGTLDLNGNSPTFAVLSGNGVIGNSNTGGNSVFNYDNSTTSSTFGGTIQDTLSGGTQTVGLVVGSGTLTLTGPNAYSHKTEVDSMLLLGPGGSLGNTLVTVGSNAVFGTALNSAGGTSTLGGGVYLYAGSTLALADGFTNILQASGGTLQGANLTFDLSSMAADELLLGGAASVSGSNTIGITALGSSLSAGNYTLISAAGGLVASDFTLSQSTLSVGGTIYNLSLANSTTAAEVLTVGLPSTGPSAWASAVSGSWSTGSWTGPVPSGSGQTAVLNASTTSALAVTLDEPVTLGTLQFGNSGGDPSKGYTVSGTNTLTLSSTGGSAAQITVSEGTHGISAPVEISGGSLAIVLSNSGVLGISGNISDDGQQRSLTLTGDGSGELVLSGTNSYTGGTVVEAGTLVVNNGSALADGSSLTVGAGGTFIFDPTVSGLALDTTTAHAASQINPVPEPGTLALLAAGAALLLFYRRRRS